MHKLVLVRHAGVDAEQRKRLVVTLVDRGGRELPIAAACAPATVELAPGQRLSLARDDAGRFSFEIR